MMGKEKTVALISCVDKRMEDPRHEWIKEHGIVGRCYTSTRAGAVMGLVGKSKEDRESLLRELELLVEKGHVSEFILMNHTDCAAYGGRSAFSADQFEIERHLSDMAHAKDMLKEYFPGMGITIMLAKIDESGKVTIKPHPEP